MDESPAPERVDTQRQWRLIAIIAAILISALIAFYFFALRRDYAVLYSDLRPAQAASIVAALEEEGLPYRLRNGGAEILAPADSADNVRLRLQSSGAPMSGVDGFELFNESDMGLTDFAQKIRYQRAIQGELARTIMMMQGVADARVHVSMPERTLFRGERRTAEAAVTLVMRPGQEASPERIEGVQRLVAASISDLSASDVVILNDRGEPISPRVAISANAPMPSAGLNQNGPSVDFVSEVMRLALPHRRFDVRLEDLPGELAGSSSADGASGPQRRLITVATEGSLTADERERVREELMLAGLIDGSSAQLVAFRVEPLRPDLGATYGAPSRVNEEAPAPAQSPQGLSWLWAVFVALAVGVGASAALHRFAARPKLSFEEHKRLAQSISARLDQYKSEPQDG